MNKPDAWLQDAWLKVQLNAPPSIQHGVLAQLHNLKELVRLAMRPYLPVYELNGLGPAGKITVTFVNVRYAKSYLEGIFFFKAPAIKQVGTIPFWRCNELLNVTSSDFIVVEASKHLIHRLPNENAFVLPEFVHHIVDVTGDWQTVESRFRATIRKEILRREVKDGFEFEISHGDKDFEEFFRQMYLPTMANRHGDYASPMSFSEAYEYFKRGFLLKVNQHDEWVAGGISQMEGDTLILRILGVRNGERQLVRDGAMYMYYLGSIRWANEHGYRTVNFLGSEPFMEAGMFHNKRRWGGAVSLPYYLHRRLWLRIQRDTSEAIHFLKLNPFVTVDEQGNLQGVIVLGEGEEVSSESRRVWENRYVTPGLSNLVVRSINHSLEPTSGDLVINMPSTVSQIRN